MASSKIAKLVESIWQKSNDGRITWSITADKGVFSTSSPQNSITVAPYTDDDGTTEYLLQILNSSGDVIEDILPSRCTENFESPYTMFREIYERARTNAMGVDAAVDEILGFLDKTDRPY